MTIRVVLYLTILISICHASHFRGGTISWKSIGGNTVEFKFKMAWTYGSGPGCTENKIGQYVNGSFIGDKVWKCSNGCSLTKPAVGSVYYYCTTADKLGNWEQGENVFQYTFPRTGTFTISYTGAMWTQLALPFSETGNYDGAWNLQTIVNLEKRSDTGSPNASPVTAGNALYILQLACHLELQFPMVDPDGDNVKCRWAVGEECHSICQAVPGVTLDKDSCTLTFDADNKNIKEDGWYGVALTIEDFPRVPITIGNNTYNTTTPITAIPLQFLIHIVKNPTPCALRPYFVPPTPDENSKLTVAEGKSVTTKLYVSSEQNRNATVTSITLTLPTGMNYTGPFPDTSRPGIFFFTLQWTPDQHQKGDHIVCGVAKDSAGQMTDTYCLSYIVWDKDPCISAPCQHNGTCSRRGSTQTYDCICSGFTGKFCETDLHSLPNNGQIVG